MPLPNGQDSEFEQFKREVELKNPSDFLQFGANYFNQKLEIQRNFIKNQEELTLSKGIVLFPPMSQHDSISLPAGINSRSQSRSSVSLSIPNFRSNSRNGTNVFNNTNNDPLAPNPSNNANSAKNSDGMVFKSPFGTAADPKKTPVTISEDPISAKAHSTTTSPSNTKAPAVSSAPSSMFPPTSTNTSSNTNNIFKGGFDIGQESSRKRFNSPLDPSDATTKRKTTPTPNDIYNSNDNPNEPLNNDNIQEQPFHEIPSRFNAERRTSVSGETLQPDHFDDWVPEHYKEKTEDQLKRLEKSIGKNFLFNKLDSDSKRLVINCLEEKHVPINEIIIKQGNEGDYFYIVEKGNVEFYVNDVRVNTSGPGSSFGELALMYNNPRAATVVATSDCVLWALDRLTLRKILLGSSFKKRVLYDDLLKSIPVLEKLTTYDRSKLADSLDTQYFEPNEVIIREGDVGENFYLIEYGEVQVIKEKEGVIATLTKGDYFGELALLNDVPRQATIKTTKKTKVATLGKSGFQRLLGPVVEVLKLKDPTR